MHYCISIAASKQKKCCVTFALNCQIAFLCMLLILPLLHHVSPFINAILSNCASTCNPSLIWSACGTSALAATPTTPVYSRATLQSCKVFVVGRSVVYEAWHNFSLEMKYRLGATHAFIIMRVCHWLFEWQTRIKHNPQFAASFVISTARQRSSILKTCLNAP